MPRSRLFEDLARIVRLGRFCDEGGLRTQDGLARAEELAEAARRRSLSRRRFLQGAAGAALAQGLTMAGARRARAQSGPRIAIIGGGLAGLACADQLQRKGILSTVYEAHGDRVGGRIWTKRGADLNGQVAEVGGEMIDNLHKTVLGYAQELGLAREDYSKIPGRTLYHFAGGLHSEAEVVDQFREFSRRAQPDLRRLSSTITAQSHTDADVELDRTDLATYLGTRGAGLPLVQAVLAAAYVSEYGREPAEQSALNLLLFIHLDRRSKFRPFGSSDERWHLVDGNDGLVRGLRARLSGPVRMGAYLNRLARSASGEYEMTFDGGGVERADAVVLAMPFSVLRTLTLDPSLGLPQAKLDAIRNLGYGHNAKTKILFNGRPWAAQGGDGNIYADLPSLQNTWESNHSRAGATSLLTDYAGGARGRALQVVGPGFYCGSCHGSPNFFQINPTLIQSQAESFLGDLDRVIPGARAAAVRDGFGQLVWRRGHWLPQRTSRGSYTCYLPGQFTTIAGLEGQSHGALKFAGEHADSFYEWQGFMEGAARSGVAAANELLADLKAGRL